MRPSVLKKQPRVRNAQKVWECPDCGLVAHKKFDKGRFHCKSDIMYFASKKEHARWHELKLLEKAGQIRNLRRQTNHQLVVNGHKICTYRDDASYEERTGCHMSGYLWLPVVEDSKGHKTEVYIFKKKMMAAGACPEYPEGIGIRET